MVVVELPRGGSAAFCDTLLKELQTESLATSTQKTADDEEEHVYSREANEALEQKRREEKKKDNIFEIALI